MQKSVQKNEGIKKAAKLILCILVILVFMFYIGPLMEKLPLVQPLVRFIDERDIDASALYYTEIEEFSKANINMENTMKYMVESFSSILGLVMAILYIAVSYYYIVLFRSIKPKKRRPVRMFAGITALMHFIYLLYIVFKLNRLPMASVYEALSVTAFFISTMYIFIQFKSRESGMGVFVFPVAAVLQLISAIKMYSVDSFDPVLASFLFAVHTLPSIMAYAAFLISMFYSGMYLLIRFQIKSRKFGLFYDKLPSLDDLDSLNNKAILTGFILLTFGLVIGIIWASRIWEDVSPWDPKILISFVLWFLYGMTIFLRTFQGWRGKRTASLSLLGSVILLFSFFIGSHFTPSIHRFL